MTISLRPAALEDAAFLADVVITATRAQGRFLADGDEAAYRAGYEEWTRDTIMGRIPNCTLCVIEQDSRPIGRLRVLRDGASITLAGLQLLPAYQSQGIGTTLVAQLQREAEQRSIPLFLSVEKDNPNARRLYERLGCRVIGEDTQEYHLKYQTLRRAGRQVARKCAAVTAALKSDEELAQRLKVRSPDTLAATHGWIVDTSIEHDHTRFSGHLKLSAEELLIALRNERHLLLGLAELTEDTDLYPGSFSAGRFAAVVEGDQLWPHTAGA